MDYSRDSLAVMSGFGYIEHTSLAEEESLQSSVAVHSSFIRQEFASMHPRWEGVTIHQVFMNETASLQPMRWARQVHYTIDSNYECLLETHR